MDSTSLQVLVIDDDPELCDLVQTLLGRIGIETTAAGTAAQAAQHLKKAELPDLIILDLMLPDVDGLAFLKQMRSRAMFDNIPVLVLSAMVDPDLIKQALDEGADRYLTKPYLANNLVSTVQELIRSGRRIRS
ncbi:MAG: response regulator receiver protein [Chloroflexi bacterium OLB15]|nr:MAG: response regulator receiver protein [Chloroflexi bacterium OLB15]